MNKPHLLNFHFWPFRQKPFLQISIGLLLCKLNSKISLSLLLFFSIDKTSIPHFLKLSLVYAISMIGCKGCFSSEAGFLVPESLDFGTMACQMFQFSILFWNFCIAPIWWKIPQFVLNLWMSPLQDWHFVVQFLCLIYRGAKYP